MMVVVVPQLDEVRLERGRRGMVRTVGAFGCATGRHNFSANSRLSANRHDFRNCARIRAMDALSQRLLPGPVDCRSLDCMYRSLSPAFRYRIIRTDTITIHLKA